MDGNRFLYLGKSQCVKDEKKETDEPPSSAPKSTEQKGETPKEDSKDDTTPKQESNENENVVKEEKNHEGEKTGTEEAVEMDQGAEDEDENIDDAIPADPEDSWNLRVGFEVEMACLEDVEALEDRIFNASLQVKVSCRWLSWHRLFSSVAAFLFCMIVEC